MMITAATEPASASSEPIERSISAAIITTVSPAAMIPMFAAWSRMFQMFEVVKKYCDSSAKKSQISPSANSVPSARSELDARVRRVRRSPTPALPHDG